MKLLLAFVLAATMNGFSRPSGCIVKGMLRLSPPYNGLICRVNGQPKWVVGYSAPYNSIAITDMLTDVTWLVPIKPELNYNGVAVIGNVPSFFFMQTGAFEDEHLIPVQLEGN